MDPSRATPLVASASASDPQALMAAYPFASSTPSAHVARHLSSLSGASSIPSFVMHGQQQFHADTNARQYAARALEMEVQQGAYQGYIPPARWSRSEYTAPVDMYSQYSRGGQYGNAHPAPAQQQQQQPEHQQGAQLADHRPSNPSSSYPYSSDASLQRSQAHRYAPENQTLPDSSLDQSASHSQFNLTPQSQSHFHQQYSSQFSSAPSASNSDSTGFSRNQARPPQQGHSGTHLRQRQASHSAGEPNSYGANPRYPSQPGDTTSYNPSTPTSSSFAQPQSSASYPSQPQSTGNTHSRTGQPDSIASSFLAPLASHQFAPRLSQPVSALPRHSSDTRAPYSADTRHNYGLETRGVYSTDGRYMYSADAQGRPIGPSRSHHGGLQAPSAQPPYPLQQQQRSVSLGQQPSGPRQDAALRQGYSRDVGASVVPREQPQFVHGAQAQLGQQQSTDQYGYDGQSQAAPSNRASEAQHSRSADGNHGQYANGYRGQKQAYDAHSQVEHAHQMQQHRMADTTQSGVFSQTQFSNQVPHLSRNDKLTQPAQRVPHEQERQALYAQHSGAHPQSQHQYSKLQPQVQVQAPARPEQAPQASYPTQAQLSQGVARRVSQSGGALPSQHAYSMYPHPQMQAQMQPPALSDSRQHLAQAAHVQQPTAPVSDPPALQPQHHQPTHGHSHPPQAQAQYVSGAQPASQSPQVTQSRLLTQPVPAASDAPPRGPPRDIYAPLAGRPLRGRGLGRPLYHGPPRVLQGGPQRVLALPQPPRPQLQQAAHSMEQTRRPMQDAHPRQFPNLPSQPRVGVPSASQQPLERVQDQPQRQPSSLDAGHQAQGVPQEAGAVARPPDSAGDISMEDVSQVPRPPQPSNASEYRAIIQDANAALPDTPPPPYEPLVKDRSKVSQGPVSTGQVRGQEVNGYAAQLQQLSLRSQQSTPQPPESLNAQQSIQAQAIPQQPAPPRLQVPKQDAPPKHTAADSAAHFEAFLSAGASTRVEKPKVAAIPPSHPATAQPRHPPGKISSSNTSSARPRLSPVVELSQRSAFLTPRKDKGWREPMRDASSDTPKRLDTSSPDSMTLSPMKRKRELDADLAPKTVKRMMTMSIENSCTPSSLSRTYDATMRTPGSSGGSRMKLVVEMPARKVPSTTAPTGMSTGKRDPHLEKLCALIDDIIEAEDGLDPEAAAEHGGPAEWFSAKTTDWSAPLLAPSILGRLTQLAGRRGTRLSEVDPTNMARILKILGRSVAKGEDIDPFNSSVGSAGPGAALKVKSKGKKKGKGNAEEEMEVEETKEEVELSEEDFEKLSGILEVGKEAVAAADCVLALLSAEKLPKQIYSEDLITSCLTVIKSLLSSIIYPYVETTSDVHGYSPPLLLHVAQSHSASAFEHRKLLGDIFRTLNAVFPRITALASHGISETMVIQAVFIGIGPFFVVEVTSEKGSKGSAADKKNGRIQVLEALGGLTSMRGLRLAALGLVRELFAGYESQRAWIVEEILGSLIKLPDMKLKAGQFQLRDGATIHVVSALLFQLVQTSAHDVRIHAQKLARKRREAIADAKVASFVENGKTPLLDEHDREEIYLYLNGLESATKTAKTIVLFLTQRSGKNKNTKSANEAEYRNIFDNLIQDLLVVLNWPEWPAANLLMSIVCKFMLSSLEDVKSSSDTAAKNMALDHLGEIATRLRETHLTMQLPFETIVRPLDEIVASCDLKALDDLILAHSDVYAHLTKRSSDDQAYDSARELTAAAWAQELATCLRQCDSILSKTEDDDEMSDAADAKLVQLASKIKSALRSVWNEGTNDMFDLGTDAEIKRVDDLAERFGGTQSLRNAFEPILSSIILALDAPAVFMRTKALRALGLIVTKDPSILKQANVRRAIESHLMDSSPAVRDAAVELIGKYLVLSPELVDDYYSQIANRIADTGLAVRKRVIKLLKSLYSLTDNHQRRVDICTKLVLRLFDEDDGIKDLAINSIEELWFSDAIESGSGKRGTNRENGAGYMTSKISVIMGVNANFRDRHSPLEDMLHEIITRKGDKDSGSIVQRYIDICDALTDSLVDAQEIPGFSIVNCIRTVHVFTAAHPTVMSTRKAVVLLPYLKSGSTADDHAIADYLLKIFRSCIPRMPTGTSKFGTELQQTLEPMVIKPLGTAGVAALPETVACLCAVVHHITHDYQRLVALLRSCNARLVQILNKSQPAPQDFATLTILALIVSLLGEHSDFDKIREEQPTLKASIDSIKEGSISEYIYGLIHKLYRRFNDQQLRGRLLQCFGFLFRAHPSLLTHEDSAEMMDAIFASPQEEAQARLLKIMQDFLLSEASKHSHTTNNNKPKKGGAVNMDELIGNTDGFAESGVSSAIIQRYLTQILASALSPNRHIQAPAVDILSFTVRQGLAHPLQCFPIIVALETSHDGSLSSRASNLHTLLHNKHASLLNSRYLESVGRSLEYQKQMQPGSWKGYRLSPHPTALLHRWYSLVREKRQPKLDFLKSFLRVFDVDVAVLACSQDQLDLVRFIAENMSAFDYKTQEEVLTVIRHLTHVLSVAGMHIVEILHQERRRREESGTAMDVDPPADASADGLARARVVTVISIILVLKSHLKHLYGITEEKASRWVPGKKSATGDKPATARHDKPISWDRVTFATRAGKSANDVHVQEEQLLELWAEDGVTAEPDDFGD